MSDDFDASMTSTLKVLDDISVTLDHIEERLEKAESESPIPRVVNVETGIDDETAEQGARLLNAASTALEKTRERSLRKHVQTAVTEAIALLDREGLPTDQLIRLDAAFVDIARSLVNAVLDDASRDVNNKLRVTAALHPIRNSQPKENP